MSSDPQQARLIAERISRRVAGSPATPQSRAAGSSEISSELAALRLSMRELQNRLIQIEARVNNATGDYFSSEAKQQTQNVPLTHSPWLAGVNAIAHPSEERFGIEEATVSELVDYFQKEQACSVEPGGKPCDHCAMCSSRGF